MFDFAGLKLDKVVLFNVENGLSPSSIYQKRSKRSRYSEGDDPVGFLAGALLLYLGSLIYNFRFNRPEFWHLMLLGTLALIVLIAVIIGVVKIKNWYRNWRLTKLIQKIQAADLEQDINNFIVNFGKEKGAKRGKWTFRDYVISWHKINDLQRHATRKGASLNNSQTSILLQHYISERELEILSKTIGTKSETRP